MNAEELLGKVRALKQPRDVQVERPASEFPELIVTVPDSWDRVLLAPLYDVHIGHKAHDAALFAKHKQWILDTPNVLTFNGGDMIENASKLSVGSGVYEQDLTPHEQVVEAVLQLAPIAHKLLFATAGNHEARTNQLGISAASWLAAMLETPYFPDYTFMTVRWRQNAFRILAHHGSGGAQTAGAQRMAARKAISWAKVFDAYISGHLHNPMIDVLYQTDFDQATGRMYERNALICICPSYVRYFATYAAASQMSPGTRGLTVLALQEDGRIDAEVHAQGKRL